MERKIGILITQIKQHLDRILGKMLLEYGIDAFNGAQGRILYVLWNHDNIAIRELAERTGLANATLTAMLDRMEEKQLLERKPAPGDRRKHLIALTAKARLLEKEYRAVTDRMTALTYRGFTPEESTRIEACLERILRNVREAETRRKISPGTSSTVKENTMNRNELIQTVQTMIAAPSCCQELKSAGQNWLNAVGTAEENAAWNTLVAEMKEDVSTLDRTIPFFESELGARIFGAAKAEALAAHARDIKAKGAKWCDCPACAAGAKILESLD